MRLSLFLAAVMLAAGSAGAADWKPAPSPLMTKWGKQVTPANAWQEYPRPQMVRKEWMNLNGLWDYAIVKKDAPKPAAWGGRILVPFCVESALSGVGKTVTQDDHVWYHRTFDVPAGWAGKRVLLHFGAVDWEATVTVNGKEVGVHRGGSDPFTFDVTAALKPGANEVVVRVWDPTDMGAQPRGKQQMKPEGIWYTPVSGIWQTVWLEPVPEARITKVVAVPDVDAGTVTFAIDSAGWAAGDTVQVRTAGTTTDKPASAAAVAVKLTNPKLWSPDSPHLYDVTVSIVRGGQPVDEISSYFAMRKISAAKDDQGVMRLMLNNKPLFQLGPLDQGWWPDGLLTPPSEAAMRYDLDVLKSLGMNMLRKHIKVEPAALYHHCDKIGLLVWQDMPSMGQKGRNHFIKPDAKADAEFTAPEKAQFRTELKAIMDHLKGFACIVVWVPFNEGWGQHDTNEVLKWTKEYDPTRLVDGPSGWTDRGYGDLKDMHRYPDPGMFPVMPDRVSVLGEFGGLGVPLKGHLWQDSDNWGYRTLKTTDELRQGYRGMMLQLHPLIQKGLAAAIYTQTTDVEVEVNGLMTYDREVVKFDPAETAAWHKALFGPPPTFREVVPTAETKPQAWKYTTSKPAAGWEQPMADAAAWMQGEGGFGTKGTPGAVVRTEWKAADIYARREFELKNVPSGEVFLRVHHDDDAEVYINGVLAAKLPGFVGEYTLVAMSSAARKGLKAGANVIAVHCHQTRGGQYIDAGLVELTPTK